MSYISEDDRIDREQAYRRKLREAARPDQPATPNQESSTTMPTRNRYTVSTPWRNRYAVGAGFDARYGLQVADLEDLHGHVFSEGAWRVVDHSRPTKAGTPGVVKTFRGETAWNDSRRHCEDLNRTSRIAAGGPR